MRALCCALVIATAAVRPAAADPLADLEAMQQALYARLAPSVVYIAAGDLIGSGFFVQPRVILTNSHVVGDAATVAVTLRDGRKLTGTVTERASGNIDLALVRVTSDGVPLELAPTAPAIGAWIASVGHGVDSPWTFTSGMVSNVFKNPAGLPVLQTQIPLNPGGSGGPIVDRAGKVVGVVAKGVTTANSVNFAIGIAVAVRSLRGLVRPTLAIRAPAGAAVFVDGRLVGKGPTLTVELDAGAHKVSAVIGGALRELAIQMPRAEPLELR